MVMTRQQAADRLGVSVATVRRLEGGQLHPAVGLDGVRRFADEEVDALAAKRPYRQPREPAPRGTAPSTSTISGDVAAGVFSDLAEGLPTASIVVTRQLSPEVVRRLHADWLSLRELDVNSLSSSDRITELEARVAHLEDFVRQLQEERAERDESPLTRLLRPARHGDGPTLADIMGTAPAAELFAIPLAPGASVMEELGTQNAESHHVAAER